MELDRRWGRVGAGVVLTVVTLLLAVGISSFGIWDPWELDAADRARHSMAGEDPGPGPALPTWLVSTGFSLFGVREWAGRLPMVLSGIATVALAYVLVRRFAGRRAGVYAALIAGTTPLFLLNARQILGEAPAFAAQALIAWGATAAVLRVRPEAESLEAKTEWRWRTGWIVLTGAGVAAALFARGALMGALPPLLAVSIVAVMRGLPLRSRQPSPQAVATWIVLALTALVSALTLWAVAADHAEYSIWLGGKPRGGNPPTFELPLEAVFHAFAPWSALLPLAVGRMLGLGEQPVEATAEGTERHQVGSTTRGPDTDLRWVLLLWAALGYASLVVFESRYGAGTFLPVVALAGMVGIALRDVEESRTAWWAAAVVTALLVGLLIRDFALYPGSPVRGLAIDEFTVPEVFDPRTAWAVVLGLFAVAVGLSFGVSADGRRRPDFGAPYRLLRAQWQRGLGFKLWLVAGGLFLAFCVVFGLLATVAGDSLGLTLLMQKWGRRLLALPVVVPAAVAAGQLAFAGIRMLGQWRLAPVLLAGLVVGGYAAQGYLPALSAHFSPRDVYDTYNTLAAPDEPLAEYRVGGRAAAYYAQGEVRDIGSQAALVRFLDTEERRWAAFPADELANIDRSFRRETGRHLFVADASSARVVLATNHPVEGRENESFVAKYVRADAPADIEHPVGAKLEDQVELLGYDLDLPHGDSVGAGETFGITWFWKALQPMHGGWKVFVHIDGHGQRINGDHEPVDGKYPVRLWDEGDVVVDTQQLTVPANYPPGDYIIFVGLYAGSRRLEVVEGPHDEANRIRAGVLKVR